MTGAMQGRKAKVAVRNTSGLDFGKWERLDTALAFASNRSIDDTLLDEATKARVREIGCQTASEAAICLLLDSNDETMKAKALAILVSRLPKTVHHIKHDVDLSEIPTEELLQHLGAVEDAEIADSAENDTEEKKA